MAWLLSQYCRLLRDKDACLIFISLDVALTPVFDSFSVILTPQTLVLFSFVLLTLAYPLCCILVCSILRAVISLQLGIGCSRGTCQLSEGLKILRSQIQQHFFFSPYYGPQLTYPAACTPLVVCPWWHWFSLRASSATRSIFISICISQCLSNKHWYK